MTIISVIQYKPRMAFCQADVSDNFRRSTDLIHTAWNVGSELVVFPELCMTGYSFLSGDSAAAVAEPWNGKTFKSMAGVAYSLKSYVAYGYVETDGSKLYNAAHVIGPNGSLVCRYRKMNLWGNDYMWATPGVSKPEVIKTEIGLLSLIICRDIRNVAPVSTPRTASDDEPGGVPMYQQGKPEIVAGCVNWGDGGFPPVKWMDFVASNKCVLAVANRYGAEQSTNGYRQDFGIGGSIIIEPDWTIHSLGLEFNQDCVVTASVDIRSNRI